MTDIESNSQLTEKRERNIFLPDGPSVALYFAVSIAMIFLLNVGSIISSLSGDSIGSVDSLNGSFSELGKDLNGSFSGALGGRLGQILLWSFVGALSYILIWLGRNMINSFENDIIADHYKHPADYDRKSYWSSSLAVKAFLAALILITVSLVFISVTSVMPALAAMAGSAAHGFRAAQSPFYIAAAILAVAVDVYIIATLSRLIGRLWTEL
jgi:hypothetical protein